MNCGLLVVKQITEEYLVNKAGCYGGGGGGTGWQTSAEERDFMSFAVAHLLVGGMWEI